MGTETQRLCALDEVAPGQALLVQLPGLPAVAVYRLEDGSVYATDALCSHGNALLTEGNLEGDEIECPYHGGKFCVRTGAVRGAPVTEPIRSYRTSTADGDVWIDID